MSAKVCSKCKSTKSTAEYFADSSKKDGLYSSCRDCSHRVSAAYRLRNRSAINYRMKEYNKARYKTAPDKVIARVKVYDAIVRTGKLHRPSKCDNCQMECKPQAHHQDYAKPLDVNWLCHGCHGLIHSKQGLSYVGN